jgi:hypothetical protein
MYWILRVIWLVEEGAAVDSGPKYLILGLQICWLPGHLQIVVGIPVLTACRGLEAECRENSSDRLVVVCLPEYVDCVGTQLESSLIQRVTEKSLLG